jgi:hypothetical protein
VNVLHTHIREALACGVHLPCAADRIDHDEGLLGGEPFEGLRYPSPLSLAVEPIAGVLEGATLLLDFGHKLRDEVARLDHARAVAVVQI